MSTGAPGNEIVRNEHPVLKLPVATVCLHYVETPSAEASPGADTSYCDVLASMELDLLAYRFQEPAPFVSRVEPLSGDTEERSCAFGRRPIAIHYPASFVYRSEGRAPRLTTEHPRRDADVLVSSTLFPRSGLRIWHLAITPRAGEAFNEFDLIKLIHLYDGRTERTGLNKSIGFSRDGGAQVDAAGLPALLGLAVQKGSVLELRSGTVELMIGDTADDAGANPYVAVLDTLRAAREPDSDADRRQLKAWMNRDSPERRIIMAYCGIVTGIFDFDRIDDEEALDTLEPSFAESSAFLRIHRRTLICIADDDRSLRECWNSVGVSPYLIIPHAALLYNEAQVDAAEALIDAALTDPPRKLAALERAQAAADRRLHALYLPNVFNYVTERTLFARGGECRGSDDKRAAVLARLDQLRGNIDIAREHERNRGQMLIQALLAFISVLQVKGIIEDLFGWQRQAGFTWGALLFLGLLLFLLFRWAFGRGLPTLAGRTAAPGGDS